MKVVYILCSSQKQYGSSKAFLNIIKDAESHDCSPIVILPEHGDLVQELHKRSVSTYVIPFKPSSYPDYNTWIQKLLFMPRLIGRIVLNTLAIIRISRILKSDDINIVHTNTGINNVGYYAAKINGIPHIFHIREYADKVGFLNFPSIKNFKHILSDSSCHSIFITRGLKDYYLSGNEGNSIVIYDGVLPKRSALPDTTCRKVLLYVGRIAPSKGLEQLLEAYIHAYKQTAGNLLPLYIVGDEFDKEFAERMKCYVTDNHLSGGVTFLGHRDDVAELMQCSLCVIVPSHSEGFGFVTAEAMFNGCIVVGRNNTGTKEQFDNGLHKIGKEIGLRFENTFELAERLIQVCHMPKNEIEEMRSNAFDTANNIYTIENNTQQIFNLYERCFKRTKMI